ncbi:MAG: hypothetical protein KBG07_06810, partial [Elusimicrobia bacterium]|nr:hypothetical protein [Elusimicrobiota bacterium]
MKKVRAYNSATAFRNALEERLKIISRNEKTDLQRLRKKVAFDRFLTRLFQTTLNPPPSTWKKPYESMALE